LSAGRVHAVQLLGGEDDAVDGVTEGASLGTGLGHADQVRDEEVVDAAGVGVVNPIKAPFLDLDRRLDDATQPVLSLGWARISVWTDLGPSSWNMPRSSA
jgi:hypothetical protein